MIKLSYPLFESDSQNPIHLYLYRPITPYSFPIEQLASYLEELLGPRLANGFTEIREEFLQNYILSDDSINIRKYLAELLAKCKIKDIKDKKVGADQSVNEHVFNAAMELNLLEGITPDRSMDYLYHGPRFMENLRRFIPENERTEEHIHIIFTDRIFCTWDFSDARYHARAVLMGFPHLVSLPGIIEAPARPREYYIKRHLYSSTGLSLDELEAEFAGQYLIYKDSRTLEVVAPSPVPAR